MVDDIAAEKVASEIEHFIRNRFRVKPGDRYFTPEVNLWEEGYIDSVGAVEMIAYIEQTYGISLAQEMLFDPDFTHVSGIGRIVARTMESTRAHP